MCEKKEKKKLKTEKKKKEKTLLKSNNSQRNPQKKKRASIRIVLYELIVFFSLSSRNHIYVKLTPMHMQENTSFITRG